MSLYLEAEGNFKRSIAGYKNLSQFVCVVLAAEVTIFVRDCRCFLVSAS